MMFLQGYIKKPWYVARAGSSKGLTLFLRILFVGIIRVSLCIFWFNSKRVAGFISYQTTNFFAVEPIFY